MSRTSSAVAVAILVALLAPQGAAFARTPATARAGLTDTNAEVRTLRTGTMPATRQQLSDFAEALVDELEEATKAVAALRRDPATKDTLPAQFQYGLVQAEVFAALDRLQKLFYESERRAYESARDDVLAALEELRLEVVTRMALPPERCPVWALGASAEWNQGAGELLVLAREELDAAISETDSAVQRRRVQTAGAIADAALLPLWRLGSTARSDREADLDAVRAALGRVRSGTQSGVLHEDIDILVARLDVTRLRMNDSDPKRFARTWRNEQKDLAVELETRLEAIETRMAGTTGEGLLGLARTATTVSTQLQVRRDALTQLLLARQYLAAFRVPLSTEQAEDLRDVLEDLVDAADDVRDALAKSAPSGLSRLSDETKELIDAQTEDLADWPMDLALDRPTLRFADMPGQSDFRGAVDALAAYGVVRGVAHGVFQPWRSVTRFEFTKMLLGSACTHPGIFSVQEEAQRELAAFADRQTNAEVDAYMAKAVNAGILRGDGNRVYPNRAVTRFEAAKLLSEFYGLSDGGSTAGFTDVPVGEVATYVYRAVNAGFFNAPGTLTVFRPNDPPSRAEAAKILFQTLVQRGVGFTTNRLRDVTVDPAVFEEL